MTHKFRVLPAAVTASALLALAGCHGSGTDSLTPAQQAALAPYKAAVQRDVTSVGGPYAIVTSKSARHKLFTDLQSLVPKAKRAQFVNQATSAAVSDHVFTHKGREKFLDVSLPALLKQDGAHLS